MQQAYSDKALSCNQVFSWFRQFKAGREDFQSRQGKHRKVLVRNEQNIAKIAKIIEEDRRLTITDIALKSDLSEKTVHRILREDLKLSKLLRDGYQDYSRTSTKVSNWSFLGTSFGNILRLVQLF